MQSDQGDQANEGNRGHVDSSHPGLATGAGDDIGTSLVVDALGRERFSRSSRRAVPDRPRPGRVGPPKRP
jgi:hypothetical protein